jgi:membrane associated rhomboid family serine protease
VTDEEDEAQPPTRRHWATHSLVVVNATVALAMILAGISPFAAAPGELIDAGAVDATSVWHGEIWRLLTACFVHVGLWHFGLNMWVMWQVGRALESLVGGARTLLIYLVSGVFGFAVSVVLQPHVTTGASGAVFGIVGALLAVARLVRHERLGRFLITALVPFVGATIALGLLVPIIDNTAHVGGLAIGFVLGYGLSAGDASFSRGKPADDPVNVRAKRLGLGALVLSGLSFLVVTGYAARPVASPRYHAVEGLLALQGKKLPDAQRHLVEASRLAHDDAATLILAGRIAEEQGNLDQADALLKDALVRIDEDDATDAHVEAIADLMLAGGDDPENPYTDARTVWSLCRATLARVADAPAALVRNDCAWLLLKTGDPRVRDPARALELARAAVKDSEGKLPTVVHTLACALADTGDPAEGLALLEKLAVAGVSDDLGPLSLKAERERLKRLAEGAKTEKPE